jgi:hypothetical protein
MMSFDSGFGLREFWLDCDSASDTWIVASFLLTNFARVPSAAGFIAAVMFWGQILIWFDPIADVILFMMNATLSSCSHLNFQVYLGICGLLQFGACSVESTVAELAQHARPVSMVSRCPHRG